MTVTAAQATARYRERHPGRVKASRQRSRIKDTARHRSYKANPATWAKASIHLIRHRARSRGIEFTITETHIQPPLVCPVLGIPLRFGGGVGNDSPSVDRFNNSRGYVPDNVRVISWRANNLKRDATIEELEKILAYMRGECVP